MKRLATFVIGMLLLPALMACDADIKSLNNSEVVIDREQVELKEVAQPSKSIRPPITKYFITTSKSKNPAHYLNGEVYLTDSYSHGDTIKIEEYWVKENDYWVYHKEIKEFPLNIQLSGYPSGGEFGSEMPNKGYKYEIIMSDGVVYKAQEIIPVTPETIRISPFYWVRETPNGRWYFHEEPKELPKNDARIEQLKM